MGKSPSGHCGSPPQACPWPQPSVYGSTTAGLRRLKAEQAAEWLALGGHYPDHGLVFASPLGAPLDPHAVYKRSSKQVADLGLPRIRLHDLRHTHATLLLAAGESCTWRPGGWATLT